MPVMHSAARFQKRDDALVVDQEDPVADRIEHAAPPARARRRRARAAGLRGLERARRSLVQPRVPHRRAPSARPALRPARAAPRVYGGARSSPARRRRPAPSCLTGTIIAALRRGRPESGIFRTFPRRVDVVVRAAGSLTLLADVVVEQAARRSRSPALHPAALAVERHRRERRRVEPIAVHQRVLAADQPSPSSYDETTTPSCGTTLREELVEALVDALGSSVSPEVAGCVGAAARRPCPATRAPARPRRDGSSVARVTGPARTLQIGPRPRPRSNVACRRPDRERSFQLRASCVPRSSPDRRSRSFRSSMFGTQARR